MSGRRIQVAVDELVLIGVDPRDARAIGEAVERAVLEQLAAAPPAMLAGASPVIERFDGGKFPVRGRRDTAGYGAGIATAVTRGLAQRKV